MIFEINTLLRSIPVCGVTMDSSGLATQGSDSINKLPTYHHW